MHSFNLDYSLLDVPMPAGVGHWTVRHAVEGVQIFGGIGSGKTSGSGRALALKFLQAGFGGLVLTAKLDEKALWEEYCALTGRTKDLLILEPGGPHHFNFLAYEATAGAQGLTTNVVQVLKTVIRAAEEQGSGSSDDAFWENALDMLLVNVIDLCQMAYGTLSVQDLYDIAQSIPRRPESGYATAEPVWDTDAAFSRAFVTTRTRVDKQVDAWKLSLRQSLSEEEYETLVHDHLRYQAELANVSPEAAQLKRLYAYFLNGFAQLSDKTRSSIEMMLSGFLFHLLREPAYSLLCKGESTVTPEDSLKGKILLLNLPVKEYQKVGRDCQILFKYIWQRAMEKRNVKTNPRPVFLWADEAQNFLHEHDAVYQATARSSRIATVYISQNLPNYYACMGGEKAHYRVKSFLGTLNTKFFHTNADIETNRYASELIGQEYADKYTDNRQMGPTYGESVSHSLELMSQVRPEHFARLKTGGEKNGGKVECYMVWQGDGFIPDRNHLKVVFTQQLASPDKPVSSLFSPNFFLTHFTYGERPGKTGNSEAFCAASEE